MPKTHTVRFTPNPVQRGFIESQAEADLMSSRRGDGKSTALCWSCFHHTRHNPGAAWAFVRDTFENLQKTTMKTFFEWFPPGMFGTYHATKKEFTWAKGVADGSVTFVGMDDPADATRFLSWELAGLAFDEPSPAFGSGGISENVFDLGMTCLRQANMKWYAVKLAQNNPDETHWTYRRFVDPGSEGFVAWQPSTPENMANLPADYYEKMRRHLEGRPDLIRRFVDGEYGFQVEGQVVTPQWNDHLHLASGLSPIKGREVVLLWDFGLTPVCIITQVTPSGHWLFLDTLIGDQIGVVELIEGMLKPLLTTRYQGSPIRHIGDPAGDQREQTSVHRSASGAIKSMVGGVWRAGPKYWDQRRDAAHTVLSRTIGGAGMVQVDRVRAKPLWHALRGGWHYRVARTGVVSQQPVKNHPASDLGDAFGYGAAVLFPPGRVIMPQTDLVVPQASPYFSSGGRMPQHGDVLGQQAKGYFGGRK